MKKYNIYISAKIEIRDKVEAENIEEAHKIADELMGNPEYEYITEIKET